MKKISVKRMFLLTFLIGIGMNIHHPVTPTLFTDLALPARIFGTSFAIMALFSFATAPFWGEMSDRIGRMKVFAICCAMYGVAQYFLSFSGSELSVLLSRSLAGAFASGTAITTMAYIVDSSSEQARGANIAVYTALQSISLAIGFLIGGFLGTVSFRLAFNTQAVWMIVTGILGYSICAESYCSNETQSLRSLIKSVNPFSSFMNAKPLMNRTTVLFLCIALLTAFATSCFDNAFNYYLKDQLHFIPAYNGILKAVIGLIGLGANFTLNLWIIKKTDIRKSLVIVLLLCGVTSLSVMLAQNIVLFIFFNISFFTVNAIYLPIIQSLAVENRASNVVGIISGIFNGVRSMGSVLGSLLAGFVYSYGTQLPFLFGGLLFLASVYCAWLYYKQKGTT